MPTWVLALAITLFFVSVTKIFQYIMAMVVFKIYSTLALEAVKQGMDPKVIGVGFQMLKNSIFKAHKVSDEISHKQRLDE